MKQTTTAIDGTEKTVKEVLALTNRDVTLANVHSGRIYTDNWQDCNIELSEEDINNIADVLGGWERTKNAVKRALHRLSTIRSKWYFERISFCKHTNRWTYCAGQDYPAELAMIRKELSNY